MRRRKFTEAEKKAASIRLRKYWQKRTPFGQAVVGKRFGSVTVVKAPTKGFGNYTVVCDCGRKSQRGDIKNLVRRGRGQCSFCQRKTLTEAGVGEERNGVRLLKRYPNNLLLFCLTCKKTYTASRHSWITRKKNKSMGCQTCTQMASRGLRGAHVTVDGVSKNLTGWGKLLGLTRERMRQLNVAGKLEERVRKYYAKHQSRK